jgi:hypothetical protein
MSGKWKDLGAVFDAHTTAEFETKEPQVARVSSSFSAIF